MVKVRIPRKLKKKLLYNVRYNAKRVSNGIVKSIKIISLDISAVPRGCTINIKYKTNRYGSTKTQPLRTR